jgi:hypothetical protein
VKDYIAPEWHDTLLSFLSCSDEDAAYARFFNENYRRFIGKLPPGATELVWVDIGTGPGTKTRCLLSLLCEKFHRVQITAVDPDPGWENYLSKTAFNIPSSKIEYHYVPFSFENYFEAKRSVILPDLITAFHVLYDQSMVDSFLRLISSNPQATFVLTAECLTSELSILRREVHQFADIPCAESFLPALLTRLLPFPHNVELAQIESQTLYLTETCIGSNDAPGWFLPFLLGISSSRFGHLPENKRAGCRDIVLNHLRVSKRQAWSFSIPDQVLTIYPAVSGAKIPHT